MVTLPEVELSPVTETEHAGENGHERLEVKVKPANPLPRAMSDRYAHGYSETEAIGAEGTRGYIGPGSEYAKQRYQERKFAHAPTSGLAYKHGHDFF